LLVKCCIAVFNRTLLLTESCIRQILSLLNVLKVLQQLPEGLAIRVLTALPADLELQLHVLPATLHQLAFDAAFPSIRRHHSLTLDFNSLPNGMSTAEAVMRGMASTTSGLLKLRFDHIPERYSERLLRLISTACRSAVDVFLRFGTENLKFNIAEQSDVSRIACIWGL
jgi:hypothetical protein